MSLGRLTGMACVLMLVVLALSGAAGGQSPRARSACTPIPTDSTGTTGTTGSTGGGGGGGAGGRKHRRHGRHHRRHRKGRHARAAVDLWSGNWSTDSQQLNFIMVTQGNGTAHGDYKGSTGNGAQGGDSGTLDGSLSNTTWSGNISSQFFGSGTFNFTLTCGDSFAGTYTLGGSTQNITGTRS